MDPRSVKLSNFIHWLQYNQKISVVIPNNGTTEKSFSFPYEEKRTLVVSVSCQAITIHFEIDPTLRAYLPCVLIRVVGKTGAIIGYVNTKGIWESRQERDGTYRINFLFEDGLVPFVEKHYLGEKE